MIIYSLRIFTYSAYTCVLQHSLIYIRSATNQLSPDYIHDKSAERKATCCLEYTSPLTGSEITILMVIGTDYIGQYTSSSHTIVDTIVFERAMCSFLSSTTYHYGFKFSTGIIKYTIYIDYYMAFFISYPLSARYGFNFSTGIIIYTIYSYRYHVINGKCCVIVVAEIISGENWLVMFLFSV
jgi:hypothetical protein